MNARALKILTATKLLPLLLLLSLPAVAQAYQQYPTGAGTIYYADNFGAIYIYEYIGSDTTLNIPSTIGSPVTWIADDAFADSSSLTSVTIPYGVNYLGDYAFSDCTSLTSFTVPDTVTYLGGRCVL